MAFIRQSVHSLCQAVKQRLRQWTQPDNHSLIRNAALDITRPKSELVLENALLRQQLILLQRQIKRPKLTHLDRSIIVLLASKLRTWKEALLIVQPGTVLRWHRDLFKRFWTRKSKPKQKQGRPPLTDHLVALIKCMVKENLTWGAERIRGELLKFHYRTLFLWPRISRINTNSSLKLVEIRAIRGKKIEILFRRSSLCTKVSGSEAEIRNSGQ